MLDGDGFNDEKVTRIELARDKRADSRPTRPADETDYDRPDRMLGLVILWSLCIALLAILTFVFWTRP